MAPGAFSVRGLRNRNRADFRTIPIRHEQQPQVPTRDDQHSSRPWYVIFKLVFPLQVGLLQLHFRDSSPFKTHPINMWAFVFAVLLCCIAHLYYIKCRLIGSIYFMNICDKVGYISGLLASAAFISILIPPSFELFVFVIWIFISFMFIEVARNWILKVVQKLYHFVKDAVSYLHDIWKQIIGNNNDVGATTEPV